MSTLIPTIENPNNKMNQHHLGTTRLIIFPMPFHGHTIPMLHLANALHSKGFSITIIHTRFNSPDPTQFPNFAFHFIDDVALKNRTLLPDDPVELSVYIRTTCCEPFRKCLSQILNGSSNDGETIGCLIADVAWDFAGHVADSFNLNRIAFGPGSVLASTIFRSLPLLIQNGYFPIQESRLDEDVVEVPPFKVKDLPPEAHHGLISSLGKVAISYKHGIIRNVFEQLDPSFMTKLEKDSHPIPFFPIGPINKYSSPTTISKTCPSISWLDTQAPNSVLYVSFGSLAKITKAEFDEIAWGLANSNQPFLWVIRHDMVFDYGENYNVYPQGFLEMVGNRGRIVKWAPQQEVLAHPGVGGFWTHCGWNSTLEAVSHGVPMICHPFFIDQKANARYISDVWRIGVLLENGLQREDIEKAITQVMKGEQGQGMRERASDLMEKANLCINEGGSSYMALEKLTNHILSLQNKQQGYENGSSIHIHPTKG